MAEVTLNAEVREGIGKQLAKRLRREGSIPGILYGSGEQPTPLTIDVKTLVTLLHAHGRNMVVNLILGGKKNSVKSFIYELQHDPLSGDIVHVDLKRISLTEEIHVTVPVHLVGLAEGVKNEGGIVEHTLHALPVACLPAMIPDTITIDITNLHLGDTVHVRDLPQEKYRVVSDPDNVIVHIVAPKVVVVAEAEGAEALEPGAVEPELIGGEAESEE